MELHKAIKKIIDSNGTDMICNPQIINYLLDYQAFKEKPATKQILRSIIDSGYADNILALTSNPCGWETKIKQYQHVFINTYGYKEELTTYVFDSIAYGLSLADNTQREISHKLIKDESITQSIYSEDNSDATREVPQLTIPGHYSYLLTEKYILGLYDAQLGKFTRVHAHLSEQDLKQPGLTNEENLALLDLLIAMRIIRYNYYSRDYDVCVSSIQDVRKLYRDYLHKSRIKRSFHNISFQDVKEGAKRLIKNRNTSEESLVKNIGLSDKAAKAIYTELKKIKIINEKGQLINPYISAGDIAEKIWDKIFETE